MRCLHCNKKLSLLKLAKGDSFCSPEHFDAHQLQLSKDAIERLMSVPSEDTPKAPLIVPHREEAPAASRQEPADERAAFARLAAFAPAAPPALPAATPGIPPYAPFATSRLSSYALHPPSPISNEPEENLESLREMAFPVHSLDATICILNLYLRLSLAETEPLDWEAARHFIVTPEDFRPEIYQPVLRMSPEFPEIENLAPAEPSALSEAVAPVPMSPVTMSPVVASPAVEALPPAESAPSVKPVLPNGSTTLTPSKPGLPFLVAPSFHARSGEPIVLHSAAGTVASGARLDPVLEKGSLPRVDSCDSIPSSERYAENAAIHVRDSKANWIRGAAEVPVQLAAALPDSNGLARGTAWKPSDQRMAIARPAFETSWVRTRSIDFELPAPGSLMARPKAMRQGTIDPQELLAGTPLSDPAALILGVLETRPLQHEHRFVTPPPTAMEFGWKTTLAAFPARKSTTSAWQPRSTYSSLPDVMAAGSALAMPPVEQRTYETSCIKLDAAKKASLPAPYVARNQYFPASWPQADSGLLRVPAEPGLAVLGSTALPGAANVPAGRLKTGSGDAALRWDPRSSELPASTIVKSLPVRSGAILPSARNWERLEPVPR
jgi:hypothetical protein